jgi:hypothetical protein
MGPGGEAVRYEPATWLTVWTVGITELSDGNWLVRFAGIDLGLIDRRSKKLTRFAAARPCRQPSEPTGNSVNHVPGLECQP